MGGWSWLGLALLSARRRGGLEASFSAVLSTDCGFPFRPALDSSSPTSTSYTDGLS